MFSGDSELLFQMDKLRFIQSQMPQAARAFGKLGWAHSMGEQQESQKESRYSELKEEKIGRANTGTHWLLRYKCPKGQIPLQRSQPNGIVDSLPLLLYETTWTRRAAVQR
ncbi:uncharacterized [Tachysurus ichikawai]